MAPPSKVTNTILDDIANASSGFLVVSDDFISTMYPPQEPEHMCLELAEYQRRLTNLQTKIELLMPELSIEGEFQKLQLSHTTKPSDHEPKLRKWYIVCGNQLKKNIQELEHELKGPNAPLV